MPLHIPVPPQVADPLLKMWMEQLHALLSRYVLTPAQLDTNIAAYLDSNGCCVDDGVYDWGLITEASTLDLDWGSLS